MKIRTKGLGVAVGAEPKRWLFRDIDATFAPGLSVVVGPNGSGKTTLLRTIAGLGCATEGRVVLGERAIDELEPKQRARALAYLPQSTALSHDLTVNELVMLGRLPYLPRLGAPAVADREAVTEALRSVELVGLGARRISTLSGGERQRVMLARMLATAAEVLVLDEPTTALDVRHSLDVLELCHRLGTRGRTVVLSLHDLALARRYADRALCMTTGPRGEIHQGSGPSILHPDVLSDVFGVPMSLTDEELLVAPRR